MKHLMLLPLTGLLCMSASADVLYTQPLNGYAGPIASSWVFENGSDADMYAYDSFILTSDADVTRVDWEGGYLHQAMYGAVNNFSIYFYESIAGGSQPHVNNPQLPEIYLAAYVVGNNAGETANGGFYDYTYTLPTAFHATAGVKYWIRIEGYQPVYPDWGIGTGNGPDNQHFQFSTGAAQFSFAGGDTAFTLVGTPVAEPASLACLAIGGIALLVRRRRIR